MTVGDKITKLRKSRNLTQEQLATKIGISRAALSHYEKDRRAIDNDTLKLFADFFEVSTDYLLGRTENPKQLNSKFPELTAKDERDIAKRMEKIKKDLAADGGLSFYGEPLSEEAKESLLEAMEYAVKQAQRLNKKYIPKKYRKDND